MTDKSLLSFALTAGAGALATAAGIYLTGKLKRMMKKKPKMRMFNSHLLMSTRCTWLIKELGAESDLEFIDEQCPSREKPKEISTQQTAELLGLSEPQYTSESHGNKNHKVMLPNQKDVDSDDDITDYDEPSYDEPGPPNFVPALVVNDEFTMIEGAAICMYLADMYGQFLPQPQYKSEYYRWIVYTAATFDNIIKTLQHQLIDTPISRQDPHIVQSALKGYHAFARALSEALSTSNYLCGEKFTAADCVLGFSLWWAYTIQDGFLLEPYPELLEYLAKLRSRQAFIETFGADDAWDWSRCVPTYLRAIKTTDRK